MRSPSYSRCCCCPWWRSPWICTRTPAARTCASGPAWKRAALHLAPWLLLIAIVYLANLAGLLPKSPGAVIPPDSHIVAAPRYLRVAGLVLVLLLAYAYAVAVERRLERRVATDPRATILVAHVCLLAIALLVLLVNPYSLLLILPAAMLWPLARPGGWARSLVPVYCGLAMIAVALVYFATKLGIGWKVWWFFFLLVENRTIPAGVVLLGRRVRFHGRLVRPRPARPHGRRLDGVGCRRAAARRT